eukprot:365374-Chlamydomonas_euryale.AAC.8
MPEILNSEPQSDLLREAATVPARLEPGTVCGRNLPKILTVPAKGNLGCHASCVSSILGGLGYTGGSVRACQSGAVILRDPLAASRPNLSHYRGRIRSHKPGMMMPARPFEPKAQVDTLDAKDAMQKADPWTCVSLWYCVFGELSILNVVMWRRVAWSRRLAGQGVGEITGICMCPQQFKEGSCTVCTCGRACK